MAKDSDSDAETADSKKQGPPEGVGSPVKAARKRARKIDRETRVSSDKRGGRVSANVLEKERDRTKGGATVKVFTG